MKRSKEPPNDRRTLFLIAPAAPVPDCTQLSASLESKNGDFDGMSHSGVLLVLRNAGPVACKTPGLPKISFTTRSGRPLAVSRRPPALMHPGPVVAPVTLPPGATASVPLRWASSNVYEKGRCLSPAKLVVQAAGRPLIRPFTRQLCGPSDAPIPFEQPVLQKRAGPSGLSPPD